MILRVFAYLILLIGLSSSTSDSINWNGEKSSETSEAPFDGLDKLCTNNWWEQDRENGIIDLHVPREEVIAFALYTVSNSTLKISAQLFPLFPEETRTVRLEVNHGDGWEVISEQEINDLGWSTTFRVENWDNSQGASYRLSHGELAIYEGTIRRDPIDKNEISVAALSCNSKKDRGDRENYVRNINYQDPDLVFFAGDQSYDHKEHTAAWLKFGMQFREIFRNRPCVTIPDDHDVGMYNLWGESGKKAEDMFGFGGGYAHHPEYVKMVERCQTSHLPDAIDPTPVEQEIGVYFTNLIIGGVDFAILEDRKFKSGPKGKVKHLRTIRKDLMKKGRFDPKSLDQPSLELLGKRQLDFLNSWSSKTDGVEMKAVLSQTGFCSGSHLHGKHRKKTIADFDSNGWPQSGRNEALKAILKSNAVHIAGDQHLATVIHHGIENYEDGPWAFVVPAIVNNIYSRWWWPDYAHVKASDSSSHNWTGNYLDGFHNKITMHAYANPDSPSNGAGYGLIRFNKSTKEVTFECWPRYADVTQIDAKQFVGWPITISMKSLN